MYIIDGTERPIQRDTYDQEIFYSGKKKAHTLKNALIVSTLGLIMWLGETHVGKGLYYKTVKKLIYTTFIKILINHFKRIVV